MSSIALGLGDPRSDNLPLNAREQKMVERMFGDPLSFPMTYKTWLVNWLEISDLKLSQTAIIGLTDTLGTSAGMTGAISILNTGSIVLYSGTDQPEGTLTCDGSSYDTGAQAGLFKVIGFRFGGSGSNFNVPTLPGPIAGTKYVIAT